MLQENSPLFFDLFSSLNDVPDSIRKILKEMVEKALAPYQNNEAPHPLPKAQNDQKDHYFPSMPQLVERGKYQQDERGSRPLDCVKSSTSRKRHATLTPGLFTINCVHGMLTCNH